MSEKIPISGRIQAGEDIGPTVEQLIKWLQRFHPQCPVRGYEGEGGAWIIVDALTDTPTRGE